MEIMKTWVEKRMEKVEKWFALEIKGHPLFCLRNEISTEVLGRIKDSWNFVDLARDVCKGEIIPDCIDPECPRNCAWDEGEALNVLEEPLRTCPFLSGKLERTIAEDMDVLVHFGVFLSVLPLRDLTEKEECAGAKWIKTPEYASEEIQGYVREEKALLEVQVSA